MTRATIHDVAGTVRVILKGHAGYNPGNDVVCAGISTLTYTFINCLNIMKDERQLDYLDIHDEPGDISIIAVPFAAYSDKLSYSLWAYRVGMEMVAENYPDYLRLEEM